jgi:hypothetical protein
VRACASVVPFSDTFYAVSCMQASIPNSTAYYSPYLLEAPGADGAGAQVGSASPLGRSPARQFGVLVCIVTCRSAMLRSRTGTRASARHGRALRWVWPVRWVGPQPSSWSACLYRDMSLCYATQSYGHPGISTPRSGSQVGLTSPLGWSPALQLECLFLS